MWRKRKDVVECQALYTCERMNKKRLHVELNIKVN